MSHRPALSRRKLLGGAAAGVALPYFIPSGVLAYQGRPGANDRVVTAVIGTGGMGSSHISRDCAALCDVDDHHLANAKKRVTEHEPFITRDYRRILDRNDIDAVFVGAPDHWHALMTVHACQAGKDVYCEKPACRTVEEGRAMINAARRYNRVVQIGAQGRSNSNAAHACRFLRNGQLGRVSRVEIWHENNWTTDDWGQEGPPPPSIDWDLWLGPARWRPYNPRVVHFHFRWLMDFGGGFVRDRGAHALSVMNWFLDNDGYTGQITVEATGRPQLNGVFDVPIGLDATWELKDRGLTVTWTQPGTPKMGASWGATYVGERGTLVVTGGDGGCDTEAKAREYRAPAGGFEPYLHPHPTDDATARHRANFLECVRTRRRPVLDVEAGVRVINMGNIANVAYRLGRKLTYDAGSERFVGDEGANRLLGEAYRAPWSLV